MVIRIAGYGYQEGSAGIPQRRRGRRAPRHPGARDRVSARSDDAAAMLRHLRRGRAGSTAPCASSWSRSRSTTRAICTREGDMRGSRRSRTSTSLSARLRTYLDGDDLTIVTWANGLQLSLRVARRLAAGGSSARGCSTCAGSRHSRWRTSCAKRTRPGTSSSWTRPGGRGGVSEGVVAGLVDAGSTGGSPALRARTPSFRSGCGTARPRLRGRDRAAARALVQ